MKVRTQQNFNRKTYETVFGISIMPDGGRRYCKYPIGHQEYKDYTQAYQAMIKYMQLKFSLSHPTITIISILTK